MSLPEVRLVLAEDSRRRALDFLSASRSRYLASAAKWDRESAADYNRMMTRAAAPLDLPAAPPPPPPSTRTVIAALTALGIRHDGKS